MATVTTSVKDQSRRLVDLLPDNATWDDLKYKIFVMEKIEAGLRDCDAGRTVSHDEIRRLFHSQGRDEKQP